MRPSVLSSTFLLAALAATSSFGQTKNEPDRLLSVKDTLANTDQQFNDLAEQDGGDQAKSDALKMTRDLFDKSMHNESLIPPDSKFKTSDVNGVGYRVNKILDIVKNYQQKLRQADTPEKVEKAKSYLTTEMNKAAPVVPMQQTPQPQGGPPGAGAPSGTAADSGKAVASAGKSAADNGKKLQELVVSAANQAFQKYEKPPEGGGSGGATPKEPAGAPGSGGQTVGQLLGIDHPNSSDDAMADARERYRNGDKSGAISDASRAIDLGGGADALALRGGMKLGENQYSSALQDANKALEIDPSNREAQAVKQFSEGRIDGVAPDGAKEVVGGAGSAIGGGAAGGAYGGGSGGAGESAESSGRSDGAVGSPGSSFVPPSAALLAGMSGAQARGAAQSAFAVDDLGGAMAFVNRALAQEPNDPALLNLRSRIYARERDYAKAAADAKAGLALSPKDSSLLRSLGFAQLRDKDYQGAVATANDMLELNPNDPYAYAIRGHAYGSMGDRDAMLADLKRAAELDPVFRPAAEKMTGQLQLPSDKDVLFLFPGEEGEGATAAPVAGGRARNFGLLVGASLLGGLLLAFGLMSTVLAPLKQTLSAAVTRVTRRGPTLGPAAENEAPSARPVDRFVPALIRGQYEISRQIGVGGMGMVYAGTDRSLGRPVAIKKMRDELRFDAREKARFVTEAKTVAALRHPNIVDIYAIAEDGDDVFLVFEFVDGKTVHEIVSASGRLTPERAAGIVRAAADALEYAHSRGVIHRDMKPSNVMVDRAGLVKVMDFGIARMAKDTVLRQSMTNTVVGTPPYMAPEQEQGHVRRESDVYGLAVCAYEMLTGTLPFAGIGAGMLLNKINMRYAPPSGSGLPASFDAVFAKAFQAEPDIRHRTPREFAGAIESALPASPGIDPGTFSTPPA
ncbi:MAG: protein kinase [Elusimicrobiota bacterium]